MSIPSNREHSWRPLPITATGAVPPEPPSIAGLIYPGRVHVISGVPESLKSFLALILAAGEIRDGRSVVYIDLENGPRETLTRLRALGLRDDEIDAGFLYLAPDEPITSTRQIALPSGQTTTVARDVEGWVSDRQPSLAVVDSYTASLALHGLDPDRGVDIEQHARQVIRPFRATGGAVVVIDHLPKDASKHGKFSIGSERKIGIADVHLGLSVAQPFGRGRTGLVRVKVHKDRPGFLPRSRAAEIELVSDATTGGVTWTIRLTADAGSDPVFEHPGLMERISRFLEKQSAPVRPRPNPSISVPCYRIPAREEHR